MEVGNPATAAGFRLPAAARVTIPDRQAPGCTDIEQRRGYDHPAGRLTIPDQTTPLIGGGGTPKAGCNSRRSPWVTNASRADDNFPKKEAPLFKATPMP